MTYHNKLATYVRMYVGIVRSVLIAEKGKMEGNLYKSGKKIKMVVKYSC